MISNNLKIAWGCEGRIDDIVDEEFVQLMAKAGCKHIFAGIESFNPRTLRIMNKRITVEQVQRAINLCKKYGIQIYGSFIIGIPGESMEEIRKTVSEARELFDDGMYTLNTFFGFPSSKMYKDAIEKKHYDFFDKKSGFFYTQNHDELMKISLKGEVPIHRRNPSPYIRLKTNINNLELDLSNLKTRMIGKKILEICRKTNGKALYSTKVVYQSLLKFDRDLRDLNITYDIIFLNNMLHMVHKNDFKEFIATLSKLLYQKGTICGITKLRNETESLPIILMQNYYSEHIYTRDELCSYFKSHSSFSIEKLPSNICDNIIYFEAK